MIWLLGFGSALVAGTGDFLAGLASQRRLAVGVAFGSQAVSAIVLLLFVHVTRTQFVAEGSGGFAAWSVATGVANAAGLVILYHALATEPMGVVGPISALGVLVPLTVGVVTDGLPTPVQLAGVTLSILGSTLAAGVRRGQPVTWRPVVMGLSAGFLFGLALTFSAYGARTDPILTVTTSRITTAALLAVPAIILLTRGRSAGVGSRRQPTWLFVIGVGILDAISFSMYAVATRLGQLGIVSALASTFPAVTAVLARVVLGQRLSVAQWLGVVLVAVGVALLA